jgi:hypothetical protein
MNALLSRLAALALAPLLGACTAATVTHSSSPAADAGFERLVALKGDWVNADAPAGSQGTIVANYRVTAGGSAVVETLMPGQAEEMLTIYYKDGSKIALTHYCMLANQPRMRAEGLEGNVLAFEYAGGDNIDVAHDMHMHSVSFTFVSPDELRTDWQGWADGRPGSEHEGQFHLVRKKA